MSKPVLSPAIPQLPSGDLDETAKFFQEKLKFEISALVHDFGFLSIKPEAVELVRANCATWGMLEMQINDPFGNAIRFGEPSKHLVD